MSGTREVMGPPEGKRQTSAACIRDDWYIACRSATLRSRPVAVTVVGVPMVLFRASDRIHALLDRCAHRNAPLSLGSIRGDGLECSYHGWRYDGAGNCTHIPGLVTDFRGRGVPGFPVRERDGDVWVYPLADPAPVREPYLLPHIGGALSVRVEFEVQGSVHAVAENALDVPHTAFLHGGLFRPRGGNQNEIEVRVRRTSGAVEAEYIGEPRPSGIAGRILAPRGGTVRHVDRFILPSVAQVEYQAGDTTHLLVTSFLTPVSDAVTRMFVTVQLSGLLRLAMPLVRPLFTRIFRQDASMLKSQAETIARFGGEQFVSTEADVLGPEIHRLLRNAERGERGADPVVRTLRMIL
jgi:phenylpropionate dioxygenase-like ring-hydroxylating dioxygenase large terminal subunit